MDISNRHLKELKEYQKYLREELNIVRQALDKMPDTYLITCETCGEEFTSPYDVNPSTSKPRRFCSPSCATKARWQNNGECPTCGHRLPSTKREAA